MSAHRIVARLREASISASTSFRTVLPGSTGIIAINAWRLSDTIHQYRKTHPSSPIIVVLAGSDLYGEKSTEGQQETMRAMAEATSLVVSQAEAINKVPDQFRSKCSVIPKSVSVSEIERSPKESEFFEALVLSNLRREKAPLLVAEAVAMLPATSKIRATHYGIELDEKLAAAARTATESPQSRYRWLGQISHQRALAATRSADVFINTSIFEGGANAVCEAVVLGTAVLATRIPGNIGILGADYPGLFPAGDASALAERLSECETNTPFRNELKMRSSELAPTFAPENERTLWADLIGRSVQPHGQAAPM